MNKYKITVYIELDAFDEKSAKDFVEDKLALNKINIARIEKIESREIKRNN